ncbi:MAG TPA: hypothetical protein VNP90_07895 [Actinomycetota bacterium]|nr:hypothetical protein [Actinomycetota bacterium]
MNEDTKRNALIAGAIALAFLSIVAGALIALSDDDERAQSPSPTLDPTPTQTSEPSETPEPTATPEPNGAPSPSLEDGRHFVYVTTATRSDSGRTRIRFDLAYFYQGERAEREAAERGDEVVSGYYIVNANPRLRTLHVADDVEVAYIPSDQCCELQTGDIDAWIEAVLETNPTDYPGTNVPWWLTVDGGRITRIEQQYLP